MAWKKRWSTCLTELKITAYSNEEPDWDNNNNSSTNNNKTRLTTSSCKYQQKLTEEDLQKVEQRYNDIDDTKKTMLKTGKVSEDVMLEYAMHIPYEHPLHYVILDFDDKSVMKALFDEKEVEELKAESPSLAVPLPEDIAALLGDISGMSTFDDIWCKIEQTAASPRSNPGLFWAKDALKSEIESLASAAVANATRVISSSEPMKSLATGMIPDWSFWYLGKELGRVEVAAEKKNAATKVLNEVNVKLPLWKRGMYLIMIVVADIPQNEPLSARGQLESLPEGSDLLLPIGNNNNSTRASFFRKRSFASSSSLSPSWFSLLLDYLLKLMLEGEKFDVLVIEVKKPKAKTS
ncbi:hypothetical protein BD560DRAFT_446708 [Blakeslea trispora]|nr:hypothetical protein BD560DRAFT_446708 [Blakeslea trispora]